MRPCAKEATLERKTSVGQEICSNCALYFGEDRREPHSEQTAPGAACGASLPDSTRRLGSLRSPGSPHAAERSGWQRFLSHETRREASRTSSGRNGTCQLWRSRTCSGWNDGGTVFGAGGQRITSTATEPRASGFGTGRTASSALSVVTRLSVPLTLCS